MVIRMQPVWPIHIIMLLLLAESGIGQNLCGEGWTTFVKEDQTVCLKVVQSPSTWKEAIGKCQALGATLGTLNSEALLDKVHGEPNNYNHGHGIGEECLTMYSTSTHKLSMNDNYCEKKLPQFLCSKNVGMKCSTCPKGEQGLPGEKGDHGPAGPRGHPGPSGIPGPKGDKGNDGSRGMRGEEGLTGPKGDHGAPGSQGQTGPKGYRGQRGLEGDMGQKGHKGERGERGPPGNILDIAKRRRRAAPDMEVNEDTFQEGIVIGLIVNIVLIWCAIVIGFIMLNK